MDAATLDCCSLSKLSQVIEKLQQTAAQRTSTDSDSSEEESSPISSIDEDGSELKITEDFDDPDPTPMEPVPDNGVPLNRTIGFDNPLVVKPLNIQIHSNEPKSNIQNLYQSSLNPLGTQYLQSLLLAAALNPQAVASPFLLQASFPNKTLGNPDMQTKKQANNWALLNKNPIALQYGATAGPNRMSYPREFKLMVVKYYYDNGQNKYRTCKEFQITKSMLNGWLQKLDKIEQSRPGSLKSGRSGRKPQFPEIERQLYKLYQEAVSSGHRIGNRWLRDMARQLAANDHTTDTTNCQFSERWLANFKRRYSINLTKDWPAQQDNGIMKLPTSTSFNVDIAEPTTKIEMDKSETEVTSTSTNDIESVKLTADTPKIENRSESSTSLSKLNKVIDDAMEAEAPILSSLMKRESQCILKTEPQRIMFNPLAAFGHSSTLPKPTAQHTPTSPGKRGRKVQFPQVEHVLYQRMQWRVREGCKISNRWLQTEARKIAMEICPQVFADALKSSRCMFSEHWLHNFKKRYHVSLKCGTSLSLTTADESPQSTSTASPTDLSVPPVVNLSHGHVDNSHMNIQQMLFQMAALQQAMRPYQSKITDQQWIHNSIATANTAMN